MSMHIRLAVPGGAAHLLTAFCPHAEAHVLAARLLSTGIPCDVVGFRGLEAVAPLLEGSAASQTRGLIGWSAGLLGAWGGFPVRHQPARVFDERQRSMLIGERAKRLCSTPVSVLAFYVENRHDCREAILLGAHLRGAAPETHQTLIGPHAVHFGQAILSDCPGLDSVVVGDPLRALTLLSEYREQPESWERIPDFVFRNAAGTIIATQTAHVSNYDGGPVGLPCSVVGRREKMRDDRFNLFSASFSSGPADFTPKTMGMLLDEIHYLRNEHGATVFHLDAARAPADRINAFAEILLEDNLVLSYSVGNLSIALDGPMAERLFASGCRAVGFDVPSGSQRLLEEFYDRRMSVSAMRGALRLCRSAGLFTVLRMCYPCPADDYHTRAETELFIEACRPDAFCLGLPRMTLQSHWYGRARAYGFFVNHRAFSRWAGGDYSDREDAPYRMRGWPVGRIAAERDSLNAVARALECVTEVDERAGLLARLSRSVMEEKLYLEQLKRALAGGDATRLSQLMGYANASARLFHPEESAPHAASERLLSAYPD